mgnify:CR=1 FL=1
MEGFSVTCSPRPSASSARPGSTTTTHGTLGHRRKEWRTAAARRERSSRRLVIDIIQATSAALSSVVDLLAYDATYVAQRGAILLVFAAFRDASG